MKKVDTFLFMEYLFSYGDMMRYMVIVESGIYNGPRRSWSRPFSPMEYQMLADTLFRYNVDGYGVYVEPEQPRYLHIVVDSSDLADINFRIACADLPRPSIIINNGYGIDVYWLLDTAISKALAQLLNAVLAARIGGNVLRVDDAMLCKLPGYINCEINELPMVDFAADVVTEKRYSVAELKDILKKGIDKRSRV